jgi:PKD repeat protein
MSMNFKKNNLSTGLIFILIIFFYSATALAASVTLSWNPPTTNIDGTPLTDLAGFKIYYGTESGKYSVNIDAGSASSYTVNNLFSGLTYYFAVTAYDAAGTESTFSNEVSLSITQPDTTPPVISGIYAGNITSEGAVINWTTDENADTQVEYGLSQSYGYASLIDPSMVTNHKQALTGLSASTQYHFRVWSQDAAGNLAMSGDNVFNTAALPDSTPPAISNVQVTNITTSSATVTWTTDEASTSQVEYGYNVSYGNFSNPDPALKTLHSVSITGLSSYTIYHFRVRSKDGANNESLSGDFTFTTSDLPPTITSLSATPQTSVASLPVNFVANASDVDGYITDFEWDFDGDGVYDKDTGSINSTSYSYPRAGVYNAKLKVKDNGGASITSNPLTITINSPVNQPPLVSSVSVNVSSGAAPLSVTFSVTASDPDGTIGAYEWDFDGNGTADATTTTNPVSHIYTAPGTYTATVKVIDNAGASTISDPVTIIVSAPLNQPPVISSLNASPSSGTAPLLVTFTANASDPDGTIVTYEWDFDGNGTVDAVTATNQQSVTYQYAGTYAAKVRVTDNEGASAISNPVSIKVSSAINRLPVISSFTAKPTSGRAPLTVTFTVNAFDPDGTISKYKWDFDGNGTVDATTTTNKASYTYKYAKYCKAKVIVIDNKGGRVEGKIVINVYRSR